MIISEANEGRRLNNLWSKQFSMFISICYQNICHDCKKKIEVFQEYWILLDRTRLKNSRTRKFGDDLKIYNLMVELHQKVVVNIVNSSFFTIENHVNIFIDI